MLVKIAEDGVPRACSTLSVQAHSQHALLNLVTVCLDGAVMLQTLAKKTLESSAPLILNSILFAFPVARSPWLRPMSPKPEQHLIDPNHKQPVTSSASFHNNEYDLGHREHDPSYPVPQTVHHAAITSRVILRRLTRLTSARCPSQGSFQAPSVICSLRTSPGLTDC